MPPFQLFRLAYFEHVAIEVEVLGRDGQLVLRDEEGPAGAAAEEVCGGGFAECDARVGCLFAEEHHVREVG